MNRLLDVLVKEAFMKAHGEAVSWKEIEILQQGGKPYSIQGKIYREVSISHERAFAVAVVVIH